jgi:hypothetical protein
MHPADASAKSALLARVCQYLLKESRQLSWKMHVDSYRLSVGTTLVIASRIVHSEAPGQVIATIMDMTPVTRNKISDGLELSGVFLMAVMRTTARGIWTLMLPADRFHSDL